jgi:hypothetical protein
MPATVVVSPVGDRVNRNGDGGRDPTDVLIGDRGHRAYVTSLARAAIPTRARASASPARATG